MTRLRNKVAVITGDAVGIGLCAVKLFWQNEAFVSVDDHSAGHIEGQRSNLRNTRTRYTSNKADASLDADVQSFVKETTDVYEAIDCALTNAELW